jgi:hypothetical protein
MPTLIFALYFDFDSEKLLAGGDVNEHLKGLCRVVFNHPFYTSMEAGQMTIQIICYTARLVKHLSPGLPSSLSSSASRPLGLTQKSCYTARYNMWFK